MRSSPNVPQLQALRAFEAVGRLLSFRRAGEELLITQSAVSHHIARLERDLETKLFVRMARGISFTPEGERYFEFVKRSFELIASGTEELRRRKASTGLRVSVLPSFASNWLVPRLNNFSVRYPQIEITLDPTLRLADLNIGEADLAIRYGDGNWRSCHSRLLMPERLVPVASRELLKRGPEVNSIHDVLRHTLLCVTPNGEWDAWAQATGVDLVSARKLQLVDYNIAIQAAIDGQGIALGRLGLIEGRLSLGELVRLTSKEVTSPRFGHWVVLPINHAATEASSLFADWLEEEAKAASEMHRPNA